MQEKVPARHCGDCQRIRDWHSHLGSFSFQMELTCAYPEHKDTGRNAQKRAQQLVVWDFVLPYESCAVLTVLS